jgi:hypothetical protein
MLDFLGDITTGCLLGIVVGGVFLLLFGGGSGGIVIKGTKKYNKCNRDTDAKVKDILKNGTGSSKEELQQWWDKYHPPK